MVARLRLYPCFYWSDFAFKLKVQEIPPKESGNSVRLHELERVDIRESRLILRPYPNHIM